MFTSVLAARRFGGVVLAGVAGELFCRDLNSGDWGAQFMGGVDQETSSGGLGALGGFRGTLGTPFGGFEHVEHAVERARGGRVRCGRGLGAAAGHDPR